MSNETKKPSKNDQILDILTAVQGQLTSITERVEKLETPAPTIPPNAQPEPTPVLDPTSYIPREYVDIVETILNKKFKISVVAFDHAPQFEFTIFVPREYSNAGDPHWEMYHEDRRVLVISSALGVNGVRNYVQKVFDNLSPEIRAMIVDDRAKLVGV